MESVITSSKIKPQRHTKKDYANRTDSSIFQLAKHIPTERPGKLNKEQSLENHYIYAKYLLSYVGENKPKDLKKLRFNTNSDNILTLCNSLANILFEDELSIDFEFGNTNMSILEPIDYNYTIYNFSLNFINKTRSIPLKVGIAHIAKMFLKNNFGYYANFELLDITSFSDLDEDDERFELYSFFVDQQEDFKIFLSKKKSLFKALEKYSSIPLEVFKTYTPKTKGNKKLKKQISKVLKYDFQTLRKLGECMNEDDNASFLSAFIITLDADLPFDQYFINERCRYLGESSVSQPARYTLYKENEIIVSKKKLEKNYFKTLKSLNKLIGMLSNI